MGCSASRVPGKIELYYTAASPPCRTVLLTAHALGIKLTLKNLNLLEAEHLKPEFIKINPAHTVPTIIDEGFILWESRTIAAYLVNMYGKDDSLYPKDPKQRAKVDSRLNFDQGVIWPGIATSVKAVLSGNPEAEDAEKKRKEMYTLFNTLLENHTWVAGAHVTIADFALIASISTAEALGQDYSLYPNIARWLSHAKSHMQGYKEMNQEGIDTFQKIFALLKAKSQSSLPEKYEAKTDEGKDDSFVEELKEKVQEKLHIDTTKREEMSVTDLIDQAVETPSPTNDDEPKLNVHV